jgi:hypothetical protein
MRIVFRFLPLLVTLLLLVSGCSGDEGPPRGGLVFGVTSDLRVGVDILELHIVRKVNGATTSDETLFSDGAEPFKLPLELRFDELLDGDDVEVEITAFGSIATPLLTRTAKSSIIAGRTNLLRVDLASACAGSMAPVCSDGQTCTGGICASAFLNPSLLEEYNPDWWKGKDICKPYDGPPVLLIGKGLSDYLPTSDYYVAQLEAGPQGGYHIYIALRMKNLRQSGSITTLTAYVKELDLDVSPYIVIFTFDPDEGGYCELSGLRFQLDGTVPVSELLGKTVRVNANVKDKDGDVGTAERWVILSSDIL